MDRAARTLTLWMGDGGRPASAGAATVSLTLDDRPLGAVVVKDGFHPYAFSIPPDVAAAAAGRDEPALLRIVSSTWIPRDALGVNDGRQLGVMVDRVEVR